MRDEKGFSLIEVAVASLVTMSGLVFLATLFTLAMNQNRLIKNYTATTALARQKLEELNAIERLDARLAVGGNLDVAQPGYADQVLVDDEAGTVTTVIAAGQVANYGRFWQIQRSPDPALSDTFIIAVRVVALQRSSGRIAERTTLTTMRSF
jgi:Tfp pilus assembly protein PilV